MKMLVVIILGTSSHVFANGDNQFDGQVIVSERASRASAVLAADLDADGDLDIVSASEGNNSILWYPNLDSSGRFGPTRTITHTLNRASTVHAADLNGDGHVDIITAFLSEISGEQGGIVWYENNRNGAPGSFSRHTITTAVQVTRSVYAADIDGDGDLDVLSTSVGNQAHKVAWYENLDGQGVFSAQKSLLPNNLVGAYSVRAGDLDGDGDLDVIYGTSNGIVWLRNTDGRGSFSSRINITGSLLGLDKEIRLADLDNDGDLDVLFSSPGPSLPGDLSSIGWYKNDGRGSFVAQTPIDNSDIDGASSVYAVDLDGDGDLDIVATSFRGDSVDWYENTNGQGMFSTRRNISGNTDEATSVFSADIDNDGDMDVLSASRGDNKIAWYSNNSILVELIFGDSFE